MVAKPSLLLVDDVIPSPSYGFGYPRSYEVTRVLSQLCDVSFFPAAEISSADRQRASALGVRLVRGGGDANVELRAALADNRFDLTWISRPKNLRNSLDIIREHAPSVRVIYDAEALSYIRVRAARRVGISLSRRPPALLKSKELALIARADVVVAVSSRERRELHRQGIKNVFEVGHVHEIRPGKRAFANRSRILFIGGFYNLSSGWGLRVGELAPNEDALLFFLHQIVPQLPRHLRAAIDLVGFGAELLPQRFPEVRAYPIQIHGSVSRMERFYSQARLSVVPTRFAAGLAWKVTESLAVGVPVIATPLIKSQLEPRQNPIVRARTPSEFADAITRLYTDETCWNSVRIDCLRYAQSFVSCQLFTRHLSDVIAAALKNRRVLTCPAVAH